MRRGAAASCRADWPPAAAPKPTAPAPVATRPQAPASVKVSAVEQKVIEATNGFRRDNGLAALKPNVRLIVIAQNHARNMARQDKYGDTDKNGHVLDGKNVEYRITAGGYQFGRVAENVGYQLNRPDPAQAMIQGWEASPGHRRNMLLAEVTRDRRGRRAGPVRALVLRAGVRTSAGLAGSSSNGARWPVAIRPHCRLPASE